MTKERLEELIKQKEWIWIIDEEQKCFGLKLDNKLHIKDNSLRSELETVYATLNNIYETKDRAEWALKTIAERTERFEPPMWEDIEKRKDDYLFRFTVNNEIITFNVMIDEDIDLTDIMIYNASIGKNIFWKALTKENYEKACEIVRDLFKGVK